MRIVEANGGGQTLTHARSPFAQLSSVALVTDHQHARTFI